MSPNDFLPAFRDQLSAQLPTMPTAHDIAVEIVRRDQRRIRLLGVLCVLLWLVGAAGVGIFTVGLNQFVMGVRLSLWNQYQVRNEELDKETKSLQSGVPDKKPEDPGIALDIKYGEADQMFQFGSTDLLHHSLPYIDGALVCLLLAAMCTVWLVFASRRTTLNRINISLAQIAAELRHIQPPTKPAQ